jgi:regulator of protease activity HflC (stomatin/prohibitin superfamily)
MINLLITIAVVVIIILFSAVKIAREYERAVIFRLGRYASTKGPGIFLIIPLIDRISLVDLRVITLDIPPQDVVTEDNIPILVDAVLYFKITHPEKSIIEVENYMKATSQISQTTLRSVVGGASLDELLSQQDKINHLLHDIIDKATDPWGIKVVSVEVKHVEIPKDMQAAIARQAVAERQKRAKIILAEGEYLAAEKLRQAGEVLGINPIILRYLETITEVSKGNTNTILFPVEMIEAAQKVIKHK